jgi:ATP:corrinoid adenosyltransferase
MPQRGTGRGIGIRTAAGSDERQRGQLHIYDGDGKGKSQAALGVVLRTIGLGICEQQRTRVLLLRFLKGPGRSYDEDGAIEVLTDPAEFEAVKAALDKAGLQSAVAEITYRADITIELNDDDRLKMQKIIDALEDLDDVQEVYHNAAL